MDSSNQYLSHFFFFQGGEKLGYETEAFAIYDVMRLYFICHSLTIHFILLIIRGLSFR